MTDNEIIKALECCTNDDAHCRECPYDGTCTIRKHCTDVLIADTLSLINRQKAEIERLLTENHSLAIVQEGFKDMYKIAQANTIKEFAERLKDTKFKHGNDYMIYAENIDNIVKKMVGDA